MKTDDLIAMLAAGDTGVDPQQAATRQWRGMSAGAAFAMALMLLFWGFNPRLLQDAMTQPQFWLKALFPLSLAALAWVLFQDLARPGARPKFAWALVGAPWLVVALLGASMLMSAPPTQHAELIFGTTWKLCSMSIALICAPVFVAALWVMRGLAPTRLALSGAMCGALAGGVGAFIYALHCPELATPFVAVWYGLGMLFWVVVGAFLGPKLLAW
jgi:hypothetical protein